MMSRFQVLDVQPEEAHHGGGRDGARVVRGRSETDASGNVPDLAGQVGIESCAATVAENRAGDRRGDS